MSDSYRVSRYSLVLSDPAEMLRLTPTYIVSVGISDPVVMPGQGAVNYFGRKVM